MKTFIHELLSAQSILLQQPPESPLRRATLARLTRKVPASMLAHFLRLVEQHRTGVATVRHGVCGGCHLRIPSGLLAALVKTEDLHICENCGSFIVLAPGEQMEPAILSKRPLAVTRRRPRAAEVASV